MSELKSLTVIMELEPYCLHNEETHEICMQTKNVRELVKCKDCIHRPIIKDGGIIRSMPPVNKNGDFDFTCLYLCDDIFNNGMPEDNFFCAYGEKEKTDENN